MCARSEIDKKNLELIDNILKSYPEETKRYINSLSRKTSYTKLVYSRYIIRFLEYLKNELKYNIFDTKIFNSIKPMDIDSYMEFIRYNDKGKEKSGSFRAANLAAINGYFKFLCINNIIQVNPCEHTEIPRDINEHEIITISDDDLDMMIQNIDNGVGNDRAKALQKKWINRDKAILTLGITTGLRISAIVGIDINDVNLNKKYIIVTEKGDIQKKIYIGTNTAKTLQTWIKERNNIVNDTEKALFIGRGNRRISVRAVENRIKDISRETGKKITPHKMRATCATRLYEQTGDIYLVQQQLGHKSINNTQRYAKVSEQRKRDAARILDSMY